MSFKEKRELETLEKELEVLEAEKKTAEAALFEGTMSAEELTAASQRIGEIITLMDKKTMRWLELSEIEA